MSLEGKLGSPETLRGRVNLCDMLVLSAYAIAVKHGFDGTEAEWLASLRGEDGISSIYILSENESLENVPEESAIVIDPFGDGQTPEGSVPGLPSPLSAQVGQFFRVKEVDAQGAVTAVEPITLELEGTLSYRYNGVELPALPEWDKEAYPFAFIAKTSNYKYLFILKEPSYFIGDGVTGDSGVWNIHVDRVATFSDDTGQWEEFRDGTYRIVANIIWSDFDMVSRTGSVVMEASEPVAVFTGASSGGGLPVVEITSASYPTTDADTVALSDGETAQIEAAAATGLPAVIKFNADGMAVSAIGTLATFSGIAAATYVANFTTDSNTQTYMFAAVEGEGMMGG